jgi:transposase-like protein
MVPGVESKTLVPLINKRIKIGSIVYSDRWRGYSGFAAKGYVHCLVELSC